MEKQKLNILPVPTFSWLGVNDTERGTEAGKPVKCCINAAAGEERNPVLFVDFEGVSEVDISAGNGAKVKLVQVFDVPGHAVSRVTARLGENAVFELVQLYLGGDTVSEIITELEGRKAVFNAGIGYLLGSGDSLDINLVARHTGRRSESKIEVKGVLDGTAEKTFKGTIDFKNGAAGAKGSEKEEVLLMSDKAVNKTVPLILCAEEDVEGNHGASVGRIDAKQVFYMQSRGIPEEKIYELTAQARLREILSRIDDEEAVSRISKRLGRGEEDE